ncbi:MAG: LacI family transcriptional regulator [Chitinophagaceae bacterium]|nr:LacI family transcriptional regulator [Chitinophagaceae bacterium]
MSDTTLKKISQVLGISISTVSRALKDHPDISAATKKKVLELADTLEYEPNATAVNLRTKKTKLFGLMVPSVTNMFYDSFISAIEEESRKTGYSLLILQSNDNPEAEVENLKLCRQNRVSGLFACYSFETNNLAAFDKVKAADIPLIFFDKVPDQTDYNKICLADKEAAVMAAEALQKKNKKNILAIFGSRQLSITKRRLESFTASFDKKKNAALHIEHAHSTSLAEDITLQYFQKLDKPDAVFCMSDEILMGAMKSLMRLGISIPGDTGVIALSDGSIPKLYYPEIAFVETSGYNLGKLAFKRMSECLNGDKEIHEDLVPSRLVEGGSL